MCCENLDSAKDKGQWNVRGMCLISVMIVFLLFNFYFVGIAYACSKAQAATPVAVPGAWWIGLAAVPVFDQNGVLVGFRFVPVVTVHNWRVVMNDPPGGITCALGTQLPKGVKVTGVKVVRKGTDIPHPHFAPFVPSANFATLIDRTSPPPSGFATYGFISEFTGDRADSGEPVDILLFLDAPGFTPFGLTQLLQEAISKRLGPFIATGQTDSTGSQFLQPHALVQVSEVGLLVASDNLLDQAKRLVGKSELSLASRKANNATLKLSIINEADTARFRWTIILSDPSWKLSQTSGTQVIKQGDKPFSFLFDVSRGGNAGTLTAITVFVERLDEKGNVDAVSSVTGCLMASEEIDVCPGIFK